MTLHLPIVLTSHALSPADKALPLPAEKKSLPGEGATQKLNRAISDPVRGLSSVTLALPLSQQEQFTATAPIYSFPEEV